MPGVHCRQPPEQTLRARGPEGCVCKTPLPPWREPGAVDPLSAGEPAGSNTVAKPPLVNDIVPGLRPASPNAFVWVKQPDRLIVSLRHGIIYLYG